MCVSATEVCPRMMRSVGANYSWTCWYVEVIIKFFSKNPNWRDLLSIWTVWGVMISRNFNIICSSRQQWGSGLGRNQTPDRQKTGGRLTIHIPGPVLSLCWLKSGLNRNEYFILTEFFTWLWTGPWDRKYNKYIVKSQTKNNNTIHLWCLKYQPLLLLAKTSSYATESVLFWQVPSPQPLRFYPRRSVLRIQFRRTYLISFIYI